MQFLDEFDKFGVGVSTACEKVDIADDDYSSLAEDISREYSPVFLVEKNQFFSFHQRWRSYFH